MSFGKARKSAITVLLSTVAVASLLVACLGSDSKNSPTPASASRESVCSRDSGSASIGMPSTERIYGWIEDIVELSRPETGFRRTGTPGAALAAAYVKCRFEALGLQDVHYETVTSWNWQAKRWGMTLDGQKIDVFPSAHSFVTAKKPSTFSTGPNGLNAELVDIGLGTPIEIALANVKGKVVVFDLKFLLPTSGLAPLMEFLWDPALTVLDDTILVGNPYITTISTVVQQATDAGAIGFVGVLADYFDSNKYYNEFYRRTEVTIPGFWVSPKEGTRLRSLMKASSQPTANLILEGTRTEALARSVVGFLPGKSKDTIMIQSHHDSVFYGAVEDGSGTASVFAQAQYFASQPANSREKTLMFATFDTHFTGYQGHMEFVRKYITDKETSYNIVANVTLEHVGKQGVSKNGGPIEVRDQPELRGIMQNLGPALKGSLISSIIRHDLRRTALLSAHALCSVGGLPTDASFVCSAGVPTVSLIAGPNYLYDLADTLDKVDKEQLVPVANVFAELIEAIDTTPSSLIGVPLPNPVLAL